MSRRPHDWSPLADSDPVPGDPDEVSRVGARYRRTATALQRQAERLQRLASDDGWDSEAAGEWRHSAREVSGRLDDVVARYREVGEALGDYATALRQAQADADAALGRAQDAERSARAASSALETSAREHAAAEPGTPAPDTSRLDRQASLADGELTAARTALARAVTARDTAADVARGRIDDVTGRDGLDDGRLAGARKWVDDRVDWVERNLKQITQICGDIALWVGLAALAVGWIPVIGQLLGAVLLVVATVFAVVALAGSIVLALQGRGSWLDVGMNLFGLVTLGLGRAALGGVKVAARGSRAAGQAGRTDELVSAAVAARGGAHVTGKALRRMTVRARRQAKSIPGGGLTRDQVASGMAAGARRLPSPGDVARGLDPRVMAREGVDGLRGLAEGQSWQQAAAALRRGDAVNPLLDDAARVELGAASRLTPQSQALPGVADYLAANRWQMVTLAGSTLAPLPLSGADKAGALDGLKDASTVPPR